MKKTILTLLLMLLSSSLLLSSKASYYLQMGYEAGYVTNIYSYPLPQNGNESWLLWRKENPFIERVDAGFSIKSHIFFSPEDRTGLSFSLGFHEPLFVKETIPTGDFSEDWQYYSYDALEKHKLDVTFGFGPIFRARFAFVDLGVALRLTLGTYDYESLLLGVQSEPYINFFIHENAYVSAGFNFDFHLMRFIDDEIRIYDEDFSLLGARAYVGFGFLFGDRT